MPQYCSLTDHRLCWIKLLNVASPPLCRSHSRTYNMGEKDVETIATTIPDYRDEIHNEKDPPCHTNPEDRGSTHNSFLVRLPYSTFYLVLNWLSRIPAVHQHACHQQLWLHPSDWMGGCRLDFSIRVAEWRSCCYCLWRYDCRHWLNACCYRIRRNGFHVSKY